MLLLYVLSVIFEYVIFKAFLFRFVFCFFMSICSVVSSNTKSKTETTSLRSAQDTNQCSLRSAQDTNQLSWWYTINSGRMELGLSL